MKQERQIYMKIVLFVLRIVGAILLGIGVINETDMIAKVLYVVSLSLWNICIGLDIGRFIIWGNK